MPEFATSPTIAPIGGKNTAMPVHCNAGQWRHLPDQTPFCRAQVTP